MTGLHAIGERVVIACLGEWEVLDLWIVVRDELAALHATPVRTRSAR